jgi:hypothetical protein
LGDGRILGIEIGIPHLASIEVAIRTMTFLGQAFFNGSNSQGEDAYPVSLGPDVERKGLKHVSDHLGAISLPPLVRPLQLEASQLVPNVFVVGVLDGNERVHGPPPLMRSSENK